MKYPYYEVRVHDDMGDGRIDCHSFDFKTRNEAQKIFNQYQCSADHPQVDLWLMDEEENEKLMVKSSMTWGTMTESLENGWMKAKDISGWHEKNKGKKYSAYMKKLLFIELRQEAYHDRILYVDTNGNYWEESFYIGD